MIKKHKYKSCCGSQVSLWELDNPIRKHYLSHFKEAGYKAPDNFEKAGVFYVSKNHLIATCSFGSKRINVRVGSQGQKELEEFEKLLEKIIKL